jgi:hypothetical protein
MRSSLTRNIFRAVIANEPYCISTCSRRLPKCRRRPFSQLLVPSTQCRSLFGLSAQPPVRTVLENNSTPSNVERARDVLVGLVRAERDQTQLPSVQQIVLAFKIVLQYRTQVPARLSRNEIYLLTEAFRYVQEHQANDVADVDVLLSDEDLQEGLSLLASSSGKDKFRSDSKALAFMLFSELRHRTAAAAKSVEAPMGSEPVVKETYISVLSSTGGAREAWDILTTSSQGDAQKNWLEVIKGLVNEGLEQDVWKALSEMKTRTGDLGAEGHEILTIHFARNASINATKKTYEQSIAAGGSPTITSQVEMVRFCIRNEELSWAEPILANLLSIQHDPRVWDVVLVSSAAQGGSVDQIAVMMDYLAESTTTTNTPGPTMSNVNSLIEYAYSVGDTHAVQDYINMASERGLQPDAKTALLQLDYEVGIGDLDGAAATFDVLSSEDPILDGSDAPVLNSLLRALCFSPNPDYELVMRLVESASDGDVYLDAESISGLCRVFLQRDELQEALALLRYRVDSYPRNDRARIAQAFKEFITDDTVAGQRAFNAYELYRAAFPETPVKERLPLMHSFFKRKRPDLACLVFGHMRQREDLPARPTPEAYGQCFEGIAKCQDIDGLQMVYNMLKLDLEVEPTTRVRNGLMAAYSACGQPYTAIIDHFWKILNSREGPTMSSFALALRACETWIPQGATEARRIIAMMQSWDIDITKETYDCYIGAIAGQCEFENTIELIEEMEHDIGVPPDAFT